MHTHAHAHAHAHARAFKNQQFKDLSDTFLSPFIRYAYGVSVFMLMSVLFVLPTAIFVGERISDVALAYVLVGATGPPLMYTAAALWLRRPARMLLLPLLVILGYGTCVCVSVRVFMHV